MIHVSTASKSFKEFIHSRESDRSEFVPHMVSII